jgi:hypothetical protein
MQFRSTVASVLTAFTMGGVAVGAEQPGTAAGSPAVRPLRFTLDSRAVVPTSPQLVLLPQMDDLRLGAVQRARRSTFDPAKTDWNCGMPVVRPPADLDPAFERKPDDRLTVSIRRAQPLACGR